MRYGRRRIAAALGHDRGPLLGFGGGIDVRLGQQFGKQVMAPRAGLGHEGRRHQARVSDGRSGGLQDHVRTGGAEPG